MNIDRTDEEIGFQLGFERTTYGVSRLDLDELGERAVRDELNSGKYGHAGLAPFAFVSAWVADAAFVRLAADSAKRDAREAETLSVAKEANRIASEAKDAATDAARWALYAAIIAVIALAIASKDSILSVIFGHP